MRTADRIGFAKGGPQKQIFEPRRHSAAAAADSSRHLQHNRDADMTPQITLIKKYDSNPLMSKRIWLDEHGALLSDGSHCLMVQGAATRAAAALAILRELSEPAVQMKRSRSAP
jgi:hypothetical protein